MRSNCNYRKMIAHTLANGLLLLLILLSSFTNNKASFVFVFNVKGLTTNDRVQWERDNQNEINNKFPEYNTWSEERKDRLFRNAMFRHKFGNREDYDSLTMMSPEERDSLFLASPDEASISTTRAKRKIGQIYLASPDEASIITTEYMNSIARTSTSNMVCLETTDFYSKALLIIICGIIFIWTLRALARRTTRQELSFSKRQKVMGNILIAIGIFFIWKSITMFLSGSYPDNELTRYGYELGNKYNDSIIRTSDVTLIWGYDTPLFSAITGTLYFGICSLAWGNYVRNYQKSVIPLWKKSCKAIGYVLATTLFFNCSEFHYFDIWDFFPKLFLLALSVLFIKIGSEKKNKKGLVPKDEIRKPSKRNWPASLLAFIFKNNTTWINKKAYNLYRYIKVALFAGIIIGFVFSSSYYKEEVGITLIFEALIKNGLMMVYLKKKAGQEYSEDYLIPQWFKNKFYKYLNNMSEIRAIKLFLFIPLFYIVPLPFCIIVMIYYILPVCLLTGIYIGYKWIKAGKDIPLR